MTPSPEPGVPLPAQPQRGDCANCGTALLGGHCHACGQPVKGLVRHFSSLMGDVFDSVFDWDARTPRTLWPLLARPGHLTLEYFAGRRVRYVSPFRLFFFLAVVAFFVGRLAVSFGDQGPVGVGGDVGIETARSVAEVEQARGRALAEIADARASLETGGPGADGATAADLGRRGGQAALRAAEAAIRAQADERIAAFQAAEALGAPPPIPRPHQISFDGTEWDPVTNPVTVDWLPDFANAWLNRQIGRAERNVQRLQEDPDLLKDSLLGAVPSTLFVLLPLFALMLKLAYLLQRRLYMEHLIVALHSHAFACLVLLLVFVAMALERWLAPGRVGTVAFGLVEGALWLWMPVYLLLMQKRVYGQGWALTLVKFAVIGLCYSILLSLGAAFTTIASLVWM